MARQTERLSSAQVKHAKPGMHADGGGLYLQVNHRQRRAAEFERSLILARTGEGRTRAMARGVRFGRKPKLTPYQVSEAIRRRDGGEALTDIGRSYGVSHSTISRLQSPRTHLVAAEQCLRERDAQHGCSFSSRRPRIGTSP
jgi:helix-turn-helix resolvase-like protein